MGVDVDYYKLLHIYMRHKYAENVEDVHENYKLMHIKIFVTRSRDRRIEGHARED